MLIRPLDWQNTTRIVIHALVLNERGRRACRGINRGEGRGSIFRLEVSVTDTALASVATIIVILAIQNPLQLFFRAKSNNVLPIEQPITVITVHISFAIAIIASARVVHVHIRLIKHQERC